MSSTAGEDEASGFSIGQQLGMFICFEASIVSAGAILALLCYRFVLSARRRRQPDESTQSTMKKKDDACDSSLFLSLLLGEVLRAIGATMSIRWILDEVITQGSYCTAQGYIKLIGTNVIDFSTLGITLHTFMVLGLRWTNLPRHIAKWMTAAVWVVVSLIAIITFVVHRKDLMGPTNFWCWIQRSNLMAQIFAEYFWMWLIAVITAVLYGIMFAVIRPKKGSEDDGDAQWMANQLLMYPVIYMLCITPMSFGRWFYFSGYNVPYQFTLFARTLFSLSGLFNVLLFFYTRRDMVDGTSPGEAASESFDLKETNPISTPNTARDDALGSQEDHYFHTTGRDHPRTINGRRPDSRDRGSEEYDPYAADRGRKFEPRQRPSTASTSGRRHPSPSAGRYRDNESIEEDFGRLPG